MVKEVRFQVSVCVRQEEDSSQSEDAPEPMPRRRENSIPSTATNSEPSPPVDDLLPPVDPVNGTGSHEEQHKIFTPPPPPLAPPPPPPPPQPLKRCDLKATAKIEAISTTDEEGEDENMLITPIPNSHSPPSTLEAVSQSLVVNQMKDSGVYDEQHQSVELDNNNNDGTLPREEVTSPTTKETISETPARESDVSNSNNEQSEWSATDENNEPQTKTNEENGNVLLSDDAPQDSATERAEQNGTDHDSSRVLSSEVNSLRMALSDDWVAENHGSAHSAAWLASLQAQLLAIEQRMKTIFMRREKLAKICEESLATLEDNVAAVQRLTEAVADETRQRRRQDEMSQDEALADEERCLDGERRRVRAQLAVVVNADIGGDREQAVVDCKAANKPSDGGAKENGEHTVGDTMPMRPLKLVDESDLDKLRANISRLLSKVDFPLENDTLKQYSPHDSMDINRASKKVGFRLPTDYTASETSLDKAMWLSGSTDDVVPEISSRVRGTGLRICLCGKTAKVSIFVKDASTGRPLALRTGALVVEWERRSGPNSTLPTLNGGAGVESDGNDDGYTVVYRAVNPAVGVGSNGSGSGAGYIQGCISREQVGQYKLQYTCHRVGRYRLNVTLHGRPCEQSPYALHCSTATPSPSTSTQSTLTGSQEQVAWNKSVKPITHSTPVSTPERQKTRSRSARPASGRVLPGSQSMHGDISSSEDFAQHTEPPRALDDQRLHIRESPTIRKPRMKPATDSNLSKITRKLATPLHVDTSSDVTQHKSHKETPLISPRSAGTAMTSSTTAAANSTFFCADKCRRVFGSHGRAFGQFQNAQSVAFFPDETGRIVVTDSTNQCFQVFDARGGCLLKVTGLQIPTLSQDERVVVCRQLSRPTGVDVAQIVGESTPSIFVADFSRKCVLVFDDDGRLRYRLTHPRMMGPKGVLYNATENVVIVVDNKAKMVLVLTNNVHGEARLVRKIGAHVPSPTIAKSPTSASSNRTTPSPQMNGPIQQNVVYVTENDAELQGPHYCALAEDNTLFVSDFHRHCVKAFDFKTGKFIRKLSPIVDPSVTSPLSSPGRSKKGISSPPKSPPLTGGPTGIALVRNAMLNLSSNDENPASQLLLVVEWEANRLRFYDIDTGDLKLTLPAPEDEPFLPPAASRRRPFTSVGLATSTSRNAVIAGGRHHGEPVDTGINAPQGIAYDERARLLLVTDTGNYCVKAFDLEELVRSSMASLHC